MSLVLLLIIRTIKAEDIKLNLYNAFDGFGARNYSFIVKFRFPLLVTQKQEGLVPIPDKL